MPSLIFVIYKNTPPKSALTITYMILHYRVQNLRRKLVREVKMLVKSCNKMLYYYPFKYLLPLKHTWVHLFIIPSGDFEVLTSLLIPKSLGCKPCNLTLHCNPVMCSFFRESSGGFFLLGVIDMLLIDFFLVNVWWFSDSLALWQLCKQVTHFSSHNCNKYDTF
jgi:hypothetical protein